VKALVWHGGADLRFESMPDPVAREGDVIFDVSLTGICGSDLHPYRGDAGPRRPPLVLGHEAIGSVAGRSGRYVLFPIVACGNCAACQRSEEQLCERRGLVGLDRNGVFAERVTVADAALVRVPDGLPDRLAVLAEPLATAVSVARFEEIASGTNVVVLGAGAIGLLTSYVAHHAGASVRTVEPIAQRRDLARVFGAEHVLHSAAELRDQSADVVVDAVGSEESLRAALRGVRSGGSIAIVGLAQAEGRIGIGELVRRGVALRGHYAYSRQDFADALTLLVDSPPPLEWLTTLALADGAEAFRKLTERPDQYTKVLLDVGGAR
jgi:threonine dehydrogenase-like Zn-dependent dehydrogenase